MTVSKVCVVFIKKKSVLSLYFEIDKELNLHFCPQFQGNCTFFHQTHSRSRSRAMDPPPPKGLIIL